MAEPIKSKGSIVEMPTNDRNDVDLEKNISIEDQQNAKEISSSESAKGGYWSLFKEKVPYYKVIIHVIIGCFFTGWWLAIIIQDKKRDEWLIPTILWGCIMVRLITFYWKFLHLLLRLAGKVWGYFVNIIYTKLLVEKWQRLVVGATITVAVMLLGTFVPSETPYSQREDRAVSFFGIVVAIFLLWLTSRDKANINWNAVIGGMLMQFIIALFVLRTEAGYDIFNFISLLARLLLGFAKDGVAFLTNEDVANLPYFFFSVLPAIAFFIAFIHIWFYFGVIQWAIGKFAYLFFWALRVSGAEAIVTAASPFIGQGESAILVKDLLPYLTKAEIHQIMTAGFATISGSVLVGYIGMGLNAQALVSSCVMSIPCSLAVSKLRYPETEEPLTAGRIVFPKKEEGEESDQNVFQSFTNGAALGLRIAGAVMIQCMCIIGLVALINGLLTWFGNFWNIDHLTLEKMISYILYPAGFLLGVPRNEILNTTELIATKLIQNEFVAFNRLTTEKPFTLMSDRGTLIATYALCGFANLGSVGITLGVLGTLCPGRTKDIVSSIFSAFFTGALATSISAAVAGMVIHDLSGYISR